MEGRMKKVYMFPENQRVRNILNDSYDSLLAALKIHNPKAKSLIEDENYSMLHDLLALLITRQISVQGFNDDLDRRFIGVTIQND
jgi:hypothetical protein